MLRSGFLLVLVAAAACSHGPAPHKPGNEYLKAIKFEGNKKIGSSSLTTGLALHRTYLKGRAPDPYSISVDADRIRGEYLRRGYLDVDVRSRVERNGDAAVVTYTVEEGVRAKTRVVVTGIPENDPDLTIAMVQAKVPLKDGDAFDYNKFDLARDQIKGVVEDAGFAHVKLDAQVIADRANHTAVIQLDFTTGPKCTFGAVQVNGVDGRLREAVIDRLQFTQGQRYSIAAIAATQSNLYALGRFSTVRVQPDKDTDNAIVGVKVDVAESAHHEVKLGGGFGMDPTAYEVRGRAGYTITGWPFPLDTAILDLRPAYAKLRDGSGYEPRIRALARLERQDLFWTYAKGSVEVGYDYIAVEAYTHYGPRAGLGFETPLAGGSLRKRLNLRVGWEITQQDFRRVSPLIDSDLQMHLGLDERERAGAYTQAIVADFRDDPIEPRYGAYGEVKVAEGTKFAGGNYEYFEVIPDLRGYVPIGPVVIAARARTGRFFGSSMVPPTERFFAGGSISQRGFSERRLSPQVSGDVMGSSRVVPYGGTAMVETGLEARFPLTSIKSMPLGGVVFLDGGDVTETSAELDYLNLHWAAGLGLRLKTIVGPVRADFGYRLNRTGPGEPDPGSNYAFHLSLGEAF